MYAYAVMYICINGRARKKSNYEAHDRRCYEHSPKVVGEQYYPLVARRTFGGRIPLSATGSNCVMSTWQSWDFRFWNFFSDTFIIPFIFEENPDGTFMLFRHSNMLSFSSLVRVKLVGPKYWRPSSSHASGVSLCFPYTPMKPSRLTQRFFVRCITSIALRTSKTCQ